MMAALAVVAGVVAATPAAANAQAVATGYLEICKKSAATDPVSGPFRFSIDGGSPVVVGTGACSAPIQVAAGRHTVVEEDNAWTEVTATRTIPQDRLVSSNRSTRTDVVDVPAGDISTVTTVEYTNAAVFGTLEVCKAAQAGSGFSGSGQFRVTGPMGFSRTLTVPVGACSQSFQVPAGDQVEITEIGPNAVGLVGVSTVNVGDLLASNLAAGTARVRVRAGGIGNQTIATFVNSTSRLKICKVAGDPSLNGTVYSFTANDERVSAIAQPAPGSCVLVDKAFEGGTRVNIQEDIVPGTAVTDIDVSNNRAVPGSTSLGDRKVSVILGSGETVVTYTNRPAAPGLLKVCKNAGSGVTVGRVFGFSVNGSGLSVPAGYCAIAGSFPFNSIATVTENSVAGLSVVAGAVFPSGQLVDLNLAQRVIRARIGAGVTEVAFTNATAGSTSTASIGSSDSATTQAPSALPTNNSTLDGTSPMPVVENAAAKGSCRLSAKLRRINGKLVLVLRARGSVRVCNVVVRQMGLHGAVVARKSHKLRTGRTYKIRLSSKAKRVRTTIAR